MNIIIIIIIDSCTTTTLMCNSTNVFFFFLFWVRYIENSRRKRKILFTCLLFLIFYSPFSHYRMLLLLNTHTWNESHFFVEQVIIEFRSFSLRILFIYFLYWIKMSINQLFQSLWTKKIKMKEKRFFNFHFEFFRRKIDRKKLKGRIHFLFLPTSSSHTNTQTFCQQKVLNSLFKWNSSILTTHVTTFYSMFIFEWIFFILVLLKFW